MSFALYLLFFSVIVPAEEINEFFTEERDGLLQLRDSVTASVDLHANWTGLPCLNDRSNWFGVTCRLGHVVGLLLQGVHLSGSLPPQFLQKVAYIETVNLRNNQISGSLPALTNLSHLKYVAFSSNQFTGSIPNEYTELQDLIHLELQDNYLNGLIPPFNQKSLAMLNLSNNQLLGSIPNTSALGRFPSTSFGHNDPTLCGNPLPPCHIHNASTLPPPSAPLPSRLLSRKHNLRFNLLLLFAVSFGALLLGFLVSLFYSKSRRKRRTKEQFVGISSVEFRGSSVSYSNVSAAHDVDFFSYDLDDLLRASLEILGRGVIGTTYKATLDSGFVVAVKKVRNMNALSGNKITKHMKAIGKLRHENLVNLLCCYAMDKEFLLVYEYSLHGSLFDLLHRKLTSFSPENRCYGRETLDWGVRLSLIGDIAEGLAFLHRSLSSHKVPHADLKSSNILIFSEGEIYRAKLTDFGCFPVLALDSSLPRIAISRSPEFCQGKKVSQKTDVYCFGIVLLEIITGRIPNYGEGAEDLPKWVREVVDQDWSTDIFDVEIAADDGHDEMVLLTDVALQCTDESPDKRPCMAAVVRRINEIMQKYHMRN